MKKIVDRLYKIAYQLVTKLESAKCNKISEEDTKILSKLTYVLMQLSKIKTPSKEKTCRKRDLEIISNFIDRNKIL